MNKFLKSTVAILLAGATILPILTACGKQELPPDTDDETKEEGETVEPYYISMEKKELVSDFPFEYDETKFLKANEKLKNNVNTDRLYEDEYSSLKWVGSESISITNPSFTDWSSYDTLKFAIYSENKTDTTVQIRFNNPRKDASTNMAPYYRQPIIINFTGWKVFEFKLTDMSSNYRPDWNDVISINLDCSGWELTPNANTVLYFSNLQLCKTEYEIISPVPVDDPSIYEDVTAHWRALLVGEIENIPDIPEYKAKLTAISQSCKSAYDKFKATYTGAENSAWGLTIKFGNKGDEATINTLYSYIQNMATGYAAVGSDYYHDPELLENIKLALEYGYKYYYGQCVIDKGTYGNWWHWDIGIPLKLTSTLIILEHDLPYDDIVKYLSPFDYLNPYPTMTACNKVWVTYCILASAFLQKDCERILLSKQKMNDVFDYVTVGDGFYTDGSFVQHGKHSYTGGYGLSMISEVTNLLYALGGSRFAFIDENVNNHYNWIFENFRPIIYDGNLFASVRGREVDRNTSEEAAQRSALTAMIKMQAYAPADVQKKLEALIRHYMLASGRNFANNVPLPLIKYATDLYNNDSVVPASDYYVTKVLGMMDRVAQHGPKYAVCVALSSTRMYKYEAINNENMDGWYQGDGVIYLYTDGHDYSYQFYNYMDPYRYPGTTVTSQKRIVENASTLLNSSAFAGGVEGGKYGIAVFELGYPKGSRFESNIKARKSYFMFDNEVVAVGSGITDDSDTTVYTTIENRIWRKDDVFTVDGEKISSLTEKDTSDKVKYMHFTNMGGYVFLKETDVKYRKAVNKNAFLEIITEHGKSPKNAAYAYVYLPEATDAETAAYSASPDIEILAQTDKVHAVRENKLGVTGYVFYEAASECGVTASAPCAVMVRNEDGKTVVTVSDPSHLLTSLKVTLTLEGVTALESADPEVTASISGNTVTLDLSIAENVGNTFAATFK